MIRDRKEYEAEIRACIGSDGLLEIGKAFQSDFGATKLFEQEIIQQMNNVPCDSDCPSSDPACWQFYLYLPSDMVAIVWFNPESQVSDSCMRFEIVHASFAIVAHNVKHPGWDDKTALSVQF